MFTGDNGTARFGADPSLINGRMINGLKGPMLEGGYNEPILQSMKNGASPWSILGSS